MLPWSKVTLVGGCVALSIGIWGLLLMRISYDDGALAVVGAVLVCGSMIASAVSSQKRPE